MQKVNCILLIDDNPADNEFHKIIIKQADICDHVEVALDGEEALNYIKKSGEPGNRRFEKPAIIFLDINMPGMNGFEFLEIYHNLDPGLKSRVLVSMLTTSFNPDDKTKAMGSEEVTEFQRKPLTVEMLHKIVEEYF